MLDILNLKRSNYNPKHILVYKSTIHFKRSKGLNIADGTILWTMQLQAGDRAHNRKVPKVSRFRPYSFYK